MTQKLIKVGKDIVLGKKQPSRNKETRGKDTPRERRGFSDGGAVENFVVDLGSILDLGYHPYVIVIGLHHILKPFLKPCHWIQLGQKNVNILNLS